MRLQVLSALVLVLASASGIAVSAAPATTACTATSYDQVAACASSTNIVLQGPFTVPAEKTIDLSKLKSGATVTVKGTITWAPSTTLDKTKYLFTIGGAGITLDGSQGRFDGSGQAYWDTQGANGGVKKPKFFRIQTTQSTIRGITLVNAPIHSFSVGGSNNLIDGVTLDNRAGDVLQGGKSLGHNTDAFDVSGAGITIQNSVVYNQDDCLAINKGSNITFRNNFCSGGHGISIGSVDSGQVVDTVLVQNCTIANSDNGVRIKTVYNATGGSVSNVVYRDITLQGINNYGIVIEQDYENGSPTGVPTGGIPISGVTLTNIHGTMAAKPRFGTYILCANCAGFSFSGINIAPFSSSCTGVPKSLPGCTKSA